MKNIETGQIPTELSETYGIKKRVIDIIKSDSELLEVIPTARQREVAKDIYNNFMHIKGLDDRVNRLIRSSGAQSPAVRLAILELLVEKAPNNDEFSNDPFQEVSEYSYNIPSNKNTSNNKVRSSNKSNSSLQPQKPKESHKQNKPQERKDEEASKNKSGESQKVSLFGGLKNFAKRMFMSGKQKKVESNQILIEELSNRIDDISTNKERLSEEEYRIARDIYDIANRYYDRDGHIIAMANKQNKDVQKLVFETLLKMKKGEQSNLVKQNNRDSQQNTAKTAPLQQVKTVVSASESAKEYPDNYPALAMSMSGPNENNTIYSIREEDSNYDSNKRKKQLEKIQQLEQEQRQKLEPSIYLPDDFGLSF